MPNSINIEILRLLSADSSEMFIKLLASYLQSKDIYTFKVWDVKGNVCEPNKFIDSDIYGAFDIYELGYRGEDFSLDIDKDIGYFDITFHISCALFLQYNNRITNIITFERRLKDDAVRELYELAPFLGRRAIEISSKERQMDLYIDYQKKVDFVKQASSVFKVLEIDSVISTSLSFFMEVFSADAVLAIYNDRFYGIGVDEADIRENIFLGEIPLSEHFAGLKETYFTENEVVSAKFNIKNTFFIYEPAENIKLALFNIITDIVPDKDFSSLVSSIVSIAVENALNHEKITRFEIEESEIATTAEILNKFVKKNHEVSGGHDIYGISYPARDAGGDFITIHNAGGDYIFCIADVCGKGYSAAILTVVLSVFMSVVRKDQRLCDKIKRINEFLLSKNFDNRFITAFFGVYRAGTGELEYISCGHDPAVVINSGSTSYLEAEYMPLGLMHEDYETKKISIPAGSLIFIYTDGLTEYASLDDLLCLVKTLETKSSKEIAENLYKELVTDRSLQKDDFTCLIMKT